MNACCLTAFVDGLAQMYGGRPERMAAVKATVLAWAEHAEGLLSCETLWLQFNRVASDGFSMLYERDPQRAVPLPNGGPDGTV